MLEVRQIDVRYGKRTSVSQLSLHVKAGEIVTLVGGNGAGKTTTLKAVSGLLPLAHGEIWFCGERMDALAPHQILAKGLAHVPEGRMLFKDMSVKAHLELGSLRTPAHAASFNDTLAWVFELFPVLKERSQQLAGTLSGGQQQQLAIARALCARPKLLVLDEPTEGIQPSIIKDIGRVIRKLADEGMQGQRMAILLCEQYYDFAEELADDYLVMERGEVIARGPGSEMKANNIQQLVAI